MKRYLFLPFFILCAGCANPQGNSSEITSNFHPGIPATTSVMNYQNVVLADGATYYWPMENSVGPSVTDLVGSNPGVLTGIYTLGVPGAFQLATNTALQLSGGYLYTSLLLSPVNTFSIEIWFKTTTIIGGRILGFSSSQLGTSANYDRHLYMANSGQLLFGVYPGAVKTVTTPASYNNGTWHYAVVTLSAGGLKLYVDGALRVSDPTTTTAQVFNGYWKIGFDTLSGWTSAPTSFYFNGTVQEAAVYVNKALTPQQISNHYVAGLGD